MYYNNRIQKAIQWWHEIQYIMMKEYQYNTIVKYNTMTEYKKQYSVKVKCTIHYDYRIQKAIQC